MLLLLLLAAKSLQSCPTVLPDRRQPTSLRGPWDSPGKNTGVGCHFLLQCIKVKVKVKSLSRVRLLVTPWTAASRLLCPWDFLGKSTGVECHCFLLKMCGIQLMHCLEGKVQLKCLNQKKEIYQVRLTVSSISFSVIGG